MIRRIRAAIAEYIAADTALADVYRRELIAGGDDETPEGIAANARACDAERAVPWVLRWYADWRSARRNMPLWEANWELEEELSVRKAIEEAAIVTGLARYFKAGTLTDPSDLDEFVHAVMERNN